MEIFIADNYDALSKQAAIDVCNFMKTVKEPLVCTASGDSPAGLYKELAGMSQERSVDVSDWYFVGLDEWLGMNGSDEGSCRYHLNRQLFQPLAIKPERICFFDGRAKDPLSECRQTEGFIHEHSGIDLAIVGLGMNGHIGMNEPGTPLHTRTHIAKLDALTAQVGQKYFSSATTLTNGITLGLANLMEAHLVFLLVSGNSKAAIVKKMLEEEISEQLPASLLRRHPGLRIYLDKEAASLINAV